MIIAMIFGGIGPENHPARDEKPSEGCQFHENVIFFSLFQHSWVFQISIFEY